MTRRAVYQLPEIVTGYELATFDVAVVKPRSASNIVFNPSVETNTTGYTAVGGSISRVATQQRRGVYSLQVTPTSAVNDGVYFGTVSLTALANYFMSVDILGAPGVPYKIYFATTAGVQLGAAYQFRGTGRWQRVWVAWNETTTTTRRLYIVKDNSASVRAFYIDGLQCEATERTTYLDGSLGGFVRGQTAYYWNGPEHGSTSTRVLATRSGGTEVKLRDLGFYVTAILGLGLNGVSNITLPNAFSGGSQYQRTVQTEFTFDVAGSFMADSMQSLMEQRRDLIAALRPNAGIVQQPLLLKVQVTDDCGVPTGEAIEIECLYAGGLQGQRDNYFQEQAVITFTAFLPYMGRLDGTVGAALNYETVIPAASTHALLRHDGLWQTPAGVAFNADVKAIVYDEVRGRIYFGGLFVNAGGDTGADFICYLDLATNAIVAMDGGTNNRVDAIAIAPNGDVYIGGVFLTVGTAAAAAKGFARWNFATGTWTAFNPATTTFVTISSLVILFDGDNIVLGGDFTGYGGVNNNYLTSWNITAASVQDILINDPPNALIRGLLVEPNSQFYFVGNFTLLAAVSYNRIARWMLGLAAEEQVGTGGANGTVTSLAFGPDGRVYAGGSFTIIGGVAAIGIAVWNGVTWQPLGTGFTGGTGVDSLYFGPDGILYAGGSFTKMGGVPNTAYLAGWNGSVWFPIDVNLVVASQVVRAVTFVGTDLYIGFDSDATGTTVAGITTVTHPGTADAYPSITITGPGTVWTLRNYTTGDLLFFNLILAVGEVAVLDLTPGNISFGSNFRPNLLGTILPGSTLATFLLTPGDNLVSLFITGDTAATGATLEFVPTYVSLDDSIYQ